MCLVFRLETEQGIFEQVLKGELDFVSEPWPNISEGAKDLVRRMLVRDPKKRLTAHEVLCEYACLLDAKWPDLITSWKSLYPLLLFITVITIFLSAKWPDLKISLKSLYPLLLFITVITILLYELVGCYSLNNHGLSLGFLSS